MEDIYHKIRRYIDENRSGMMALWEELVNTESGSRQLEGLERVLNILRREMVRSGMETRTVAMENAGDVLIGEWNRESGAAPILFIGHMDTVFQEGAVAENPFRVDQDGRAHGPGVLDMKAGLVIALYAVRALADAGYQKRPVKCVFVGDEENLHMFSSAKEIIAGEAAGAVAAFNFETGYPDDGLVTGRKGGGIIDVTVHGVPSHSGIAPEKGRSAVLEMAQKIIEIESRNDIARGKLMNCGMIKGGIGENTVPGECQINIGIRFPTTAIRDEILSDIRAAADTVHVADTTAQVNVRMLMECMEPTDGVMGLFEHVRRAALDCGYGEVYPMTVSGVSDSGVAVISGVPTVCAMGVKGEGNHTKEEYAQVESLFSRAVLAASAVYTLE